jgi:hypothetical protein
MVSAGPRQAFISNIFLIIQISKAARIKLTTLTSEYVFGPIENFRMLREDRISAEALTVLTNPLANKARRIPSKKAEIVGAKKSKTFFLCIIKKAP